MLSDYETKFYESYGELINKNSISTSLISFRDIKEFSHFDKALWNLNEESPTLGIQKVDNKRISEYFDIVETKAYFYQKEYENHPYIEIGGIELRTSFYIHSDKPKCFNKEQKKQGEIEGGILGRKGDVLISMVRTYRGGFTLLNENAIVSGAGFLVLRPTGEISGVELLSMLKNNLKQIIRYVNFVGNGKTYPKMDKQDFVKIFVDKEYSKKAKETFKNSLLQEIGLIFG